MTAPAPGEPTAEGETPFRPHARRVRTVAVAVGLALITAGSLWGHDDDFPVGPLKMYSYRDDPNGEVTQAVVLATTRAGRTFDVTDMAGVPRRAELEGRFGEFELQPTRFAGVAAQYVSPDLHLRDHPGEVVTQIRLVRRVYALRDGRRRAGSVDELVARWMPTGTGS